MVSNSNQKTSPTFICSKTIPDKSIPVRTMSFFRVHSKTQIGGYRLDEPTLETWARIITHLEGPLVLRIKEGEKNPTVKAPGQNKKELALSSGAKRKPSFMGLFHFAHWMRDLPNMMASTAPPAQNSIRIWKKWLDNVPLRTWVTLSPINKTDLLYKYVHFFPQNKLTGY